MKSQRIANAGSTLEIDFSSCQWVDPLPMMALLCHLNRWAASHDQLIGRELIIDLGCASTRPEDIGTARARLFLAAHGFLRAIFVSCPDAIIRYVSELDQFPVEFRADPRDQLEDAIGTSAGCELLYGKDPVCPPLILSSGETADSIANFVDTAVKTMDAKLFSGRQSEFIYRDSALVRARQVSTEIILNACEHAYPDADPGPICFYARVRQHPKHPHEKEVETTNHSPLINYIQDCTSGRYIELFICDIGRGLAQHAEEWKTAAPDDSTRKEVADSSLKCNSVMTRV